MQRGRNQLKNLSIMYAIREMITKGTFCGMGAMGGCYFMSFQEIRQMKKH